MRISVMITTRNRCADLRRTLGVLDAMNPRPDEILVTADGCTDGTVAMVREEYPQCRLIVNDPGHGSIPSRDRMLREAVGDLVVSLDDDSYPLDFDFFARLPTLFEVHPEAAVITFPEIRDGDDPAGQTWDLRGHYVAAYPNGAAAMRRATYLNLQGFPTLFFHAYEEPDYAAQCYGHGMAVWFEPSMAIRHHYSPVNRDELRTHQLNARNELWSVWLRCPWPWVPFVSLYRVWRQLVFACSRGGSWVVREPLWWWDALKGMPACVDSRRPVAWQRYFTWMRQARQPLRDAAELKRKLGVSANS